MQKVLICFVQLFCGFCKFLTITWFHQYCGLEHHYHQFCCICLSCDEAFQVVLHSPPFSSTRLHNCNSQPYVCTTLLYKFVNILGIFPPQCFTMIKL